MAWPAGDGTSSIRLFVKREMDYLSLNRQRHGRSARGLCKEYIEHGGARQRHGRAARGLETGHRAWRRPSSFRTFRPGAGNRASAVMGKCRKTSALLRSR